MIASSSQNELQKEHFNRFSEVLAKEAEEFDFHSQKLFDYFLQIAEPNERERILELGCGTGRYTLPLLRMGLRLSCLDLSEKCLNVLRERALKEGLEKNLTLRLAGIEDEGTDNFDFIFGIHFLHHSEDIGKTVLSASRRIRSGGRAVFLEPNPFNPYWYPYIWLNKARSWQAEKGILKCRPGQLARAFRRCGFRQVRLHTYGIMPIPLINRYHSLWKMESILNTLPALRWISAVQIIYGVKV